MVQRWDVKLVQREEKPLERALTISYLAAIHRENPEDIIRLLKMIEKATSLKEKPSDYLFAIAEEERAKREANTQPGKEIE